MKYSMIEFKKELKSLGIKITNYRPEKPRPIIVDGIGPVNAERFAREALKIIQTKGLSDFQTTLKIISDVARCHRTLKKYCEKEGLVEGDPVSKILIPEAYKELTLNLDQSHIGRDLRFFMTTPDEYVSEIAGPVYLKVSNIQEEQAIKMARKVVTEYLPRNERGVSVKQNNSGETIEVYNTYVPPVWDLYEDRVPDKLPRLFRKLVYHLFPLEIEREYFFTWLYNSLFKRSYVYLVLCGAPGTGKNRLKLVLRALHGFQNTVDGKRSTLVDRFNSQLAEATLAWFDELKYDHDMENVMKEIQNDTISIERKNFDATRSTRLYASLIVSNNKPRDNYIAFDARKFCPLVISKHRLETSMTYEEIQELTEKVENREHANFDIKFLAQIGRWIKKHGDSGKWPNLEYRGPMFYKLAHTSMSRWQKRAVMTMLELKTNVHSRIQADPEKGVRWSEVEDKILKAGKEKTMQFPDYSSVRHFFDVFVDGVGAKTFKTLGIRNNILGDFWVKVIKQDAEVLTDANDEIELPKTIKNRIEAVDRIPLKERNRQKRLAEAKAWRLAREAELEKGKKKKRAAHEIL